MYDDPHNIEGVMIRTVIGNFLVCSLLVTESLDVQDIAMARMMERYAADLMPIATKDET